MVVMGHDIVTKMVSNNIIFLKKATGISYPPRLITLDIPDNPRCV
jgi:hypothetical protein